MVEHKKPAPPPGIYPDTEMSEYLAWDAASSGGLSALARSPAHYVASIAHPAESEAFAIGEAIHCAVLEPDCFEDRYVIAEQCEAITGKGTRCSNPGLVLHRELGWACGVHLKGYNASGIVSTVTTLSGEDYGICVGVRESIRRHATAHGLICGPGRQELSMTWEDRGTGVLCKARWDRYSEDITGGAVVDVKSTVDAHPREFERSIVKFGYHRKAAHYLAGGQAHQIPAKHFAIIAVEKKPPYAVAVYRISDVVVAAAAEQTEALLRLYAHCKTTGSWPAYPDEVRDIHIPDWAWRVMDEQTQEIEERRKIA